MSSLLASVWRDTPELFELDGRRPVADAFSRAQQALQDMLTAPGSVHLVITHKSLLRALLCCALELPHTKFRALDIANGAVCLVRGNTRGQLMLSALNLTSHLHMDGVQYHLPVASDPNDVLAAAAAAGNIRSLA